MRPSEPPGWDQEVRPIAPPAPLSRQPPPLPASGGGSSRRRSRAPATAPAPAGDIEANTPLQGEGASLDDQIRAAVKVAQIKATENPGNFHQAVAVHVLGGGAAASQVARPENVSRMTNAEMRLAWEAAEGGISKQEVLVCHFSSLASSGLILGESSPGFRASTVGQGGGGVSVVGVGPHELDWDSYQSGGFRATTGRELWGQKAADVTLGGKDDDKLDVVFFIKLPLSYFQASMRVPGRELIRIVPASVLYEQDGDHWLQKSKIVKTYVLLRDAPALEIEGEGGAQQSLTTKLGFAALGLLLVVFQAVVLIALIWGSCFPSCTMTSHCTRGGMYCAPHDTAGLGFGGRCQYCAAAAEETGVLDAVEHCANHTTWKSSYCSVDSSGLVAAQLGGEPLPCPHPACILCQEQPSWGVEERVWLNDPAYSTSTWGSTSRAIVASSNVMAMQISDLVTYFIMVAVVSLSLANEVRDVQLCEITIQARSGGNRLQATSLAEKVALGLIGAIWCIGATRIFLDMKIWNYPLSSGPMPDVLGSSPTWWLIAHYINGFGCLGAVLTAADVRSGNSIWRLPLLTMQAMRRYAVVPAVAITVNILLVSYGGDTLSLTLNTVGTLVLL
jgi:hypothetical protein